MLEVTVNSLGNPYSETCMRKRKGCGREDLQKRKDLAYRHGLAVFELSTSA